MEYFQSQIHATWHSHNVILLQSASVNEWKLGTVYSLIIHAMKGKRLILKVSDSGV